MIFLIINKIFIGHYEFLIIILYIISFLMNIIIFKHFKIFLFLYMIFAIKAILNMLMNNNV